MPSVETGSDQYTDSPMPVDPEQEYEQTHPYPETIQITDTEQGHSVTLHPILDEQLDTRLPLTEVAQQHLPTGHVDTAAKLRALVASDGGQMWGIHPIIDGEESATPIGVVGIGRGDDVHVTSTVLFDPEQDGGKGYGTAAKIGAMSVGYSKDTDLFGTQIAQDNIASQRSAAKAGYVRLPEKEGTPPMAGPVGPSGNRITWETWVAFNPSDDKKLPEMFDLSRQTFRTASKRYIVDTDPLPKPEA